MRIRTTDCCLTQKGSGIVMTQEQLNQNECQILIYSVQDFLARHSLSPESEKDLLTQEELSFEIARILEAKRPSYFILENVPGLLSHDKGRTFCTILSTLSELGYHVEWKVLNSKDFGVPKQESGCILSDILISDVPEKYYLNQKQMEQLLFKSGQEVREKESTVQKD